MKREVRILLAVFTFLATIAITAMAQPKPLNLPEGSGNFKTVGQFLYFVTSGSLYRTDGTDEGTLLLRDGGNPNLLTFTEFHGLAIWFEGGALWRSDGTPSGTIPLTSSSLNSAHVLDSTDNYLFLAVATTANGTEIFRTDGTPPGTIMVKDVNPGSASGYRGSYVVLGNHIFFTGNDGLSGVELWKTDGTTAGTLLVEDVNPGSGDGVSSGLTLAGARIFFAGNDGTHGIEPWTTDGTSVGTVMAKDIRPGADRGFGEVFQAAGDYFYFKSFNPEEPDLWVTDGTEQGTMLLKLGDFYAMTSANGRAFFYTIIEVPGPGFQPEIWKSEGTHASTVKLGSLCVDCHFTPHPFLSYNDKVYFVAEDYNGLEQYVWKTDGTEAGTGIIFSEFLDGPLRFFQLVNRFVYFYTTSQGNNLALYAYDAEESIGSMSRRFRQAQLQRPIEISAAGDFVFFEDHDGPSDEGSALNPEDAFQLFQTDGRNVLSLRDIFGIPFQNSGRVIDFNGKALIRGETNPRWWIYEPGWEKAGVVQQELWNSVPGTKVSAIPVDSPPSSTSDLTIFETPANIGDNYGSRVRGYVVVPETGEYTFWLSSDDQSELWLSTDEDPSKKIKIAQVTGWTNSRQWDKYSSQKSASKNLIAGRKYYIEALLKEGSGGDHLAVGWQLPNGTLERPIPGKRLISYERPTSLPKIAITSPRDGQVYTSPANVSITTSVDGSISKVEFYNGNVKLGEDATHPFTFEWNNVLEGNYTLVAKAIDINGKSGADQLNFFVSAGTSCAGAGMIQQEFWMAVPGTRVTAIPLDREPDFIRDLVDFVGPPNDFVADNYGSRIRGYICPPSSGQYTFWVSGDDNVELWLSTDSNPANKRKIAYHTGWTNRNEWNKYSTQQSVAITLAAKQKYYIEALMKEGSGGDHISVGWRVPGAQLTTLRGAYLIPFESQTSEPTCEGTGTISLETWTGIDGVHVSSIPVTSPPNFTGERTLFEAPTNVGSNFGTRASGYICAPVSGNYTFWIASDDHGELWLSTDEDPVNKRRIAYHTGWTSPRQWTKHSTQQSATIALVAGQQYYVEALYKEDEGGDNMAVGWQLPDGTMERPIPGNRLSPFKPTTSSTLVSTSSEAQLYSQIDVYPNPAHGGDPQLTISGYEAIGSIVETHVEIINVTGEVVVAESIQCGGNCSAYLMRLKTSLKPGLYLIKLNTNGARHIKRLLVK